LIPIICTVLKDIDFGIVFWRKQACLISRSAKANRRRPILVCPMSSLVKTRQRTSTRS
jgi:hypothetical protein